LYLGQFTRFEGIGSNLDLVSAEFLDDDASCQFDETKSVESSDELESIQDPSMNAAMQSPLPEEESAAHEDPIEVEER